jgi:hypothetical protein
MRTLRASWWIGVSCGLLLGGVALQAQQQAGAPAPTASVTGTVIFGDTQRPARFVQVDLQAIPSASASNDNRGRGFGGGGGFARTGLDGTFAIANVAPGDYWVLATAPGYVSERTLLQAGVNAGATAADLMTQMPTVHVSTSGSGSITLTLVRGAALSGRLQWEDGSPATGVDVVADPAVTPAALPAPLNSLRAYSTTRATTDDRGAFRLLGLASGDYVLEVQLHPTVQFGGGGRGYANMIRVYAPGVFRKADAKPITIKAGDERDDLRMVLNLSKLRTVSGHVNSAVAGFNVLSGRVSLVDTTDATVQLSGTINASGDFSILYVPAGTYTLSAQGSTQAVTMGYRGRGGATTSGTTFQPYTQTLTVGDTDVTGMGINLLSAQQ